jgi:hypothetical protein
MSWFSLETFSTTFTELSNKVGGVVTIIEEKANEFMNQEEIPQKPAQLYWNSPPENWKETPEKLKEEILRISTNPKNFQIPPTESFYFIFEENLKQAQLMLNTDKNIKKNLFELVPEQYSNFSFLKPSLCEEDFWKNYFYRVELILNNSDIKVLQRDIDILNNDLKQDLSDYEPLKKNLGEIEESLKLFQGIVEESFIEFSTNKNVEKIDFGYLHALHSKVVNEKKEIGLWILEIQNEQLLDSSMKLNEKIHEVLTKYDEFNRLVELVNSVPLEEKVEEKVEKNETPKVVFVNKDHDSDDEFDEFLQQSEEIRTKSVPTVEDHGDVNLDEESKLPWEEE